MPSFHISFPRLSGGAQIHLRTFGFSHVRERQPRQRFQLGWKTQLFSLLSTTLAFFLTWGKPNTIRAIFFVLYCVGWRLKMEKRRGELKSTLSQALFETFLCSFAIIPFHIVSVSFEKSPNPSARASFPHVRERQPRKSSIYS